MKGATTAKVIAADAMTRVACVLGIFQLDFYCLVEDI